MKVILKRFKDDGCKNKITLVEYGNSLEKKGWLFRAGEGGFISPDYSTIFVYNRNGCYGQLLQHAQDKETEYNACVNDFINSGEFVEI